MRLHTITASAFLAVLFSTASAGSSTIMSITPSSTSSLTASQTDCQACINKAIIDTKPSCVGVSYLGNVDNIVFDKLSNKEKTCLCSMTASNDWYHTCVRPDACTAGMLDAMDETIVALKAKVFCPNGGVFTDSTSAVGGCVVPGSKAAAVGLGVAVVISALV